MMLAPQRHTSAYRLLQLCACQCLILGIITGLQAQHMVGHCIFSMLFFERQPTRRDVYTVLHVPSMSARFLALPTLTFHMCVPLQNITFLSEMRARANEGERSRQTCNSLYGKRSQSLKAIVQFSEQPQITIRLMFCSPCRRTCWSSKASVSEQRKSDCL
jgi:hypothetical protein